MAEGGGVPRPKGIRFLVIIAMVVSSWLMNNGTAAATPFTPTFAASVSNANPGVRSNSTTVHSVSAGQPLIDSVNVFIPIDWQVADGGTYPVGNSVGEVSMKVDLGCNGSVDTLSPGSLINQPLGPQDPSQAEWLATVNGSWQLLFIVEQTSQPREWQISVTLNNASMPANICSPQEFKLAINGSASPSGAQVVANPTHAGTYTWDDGLLSLDSQVVFISDDVVIGVDGDADGLANTIDNCPTVPNPDQLDTDGDAVGNACDADDDNDRFSDPVEASAGTDPLAACGVNTWPADINNDGFSDGTDITIIAGSFGEAVPPAGMAPVRHNIAPDPVDGFVDGTDITTMAGFFGDPCGS
jgi:Thrombospondin type 3 repeat